MADEPAPDVPAESGSIPPASSAPTAAPSRGSRKAAPSAASEPPSPEDGTTSATGESADTPADGAAEAPEPRPGWYRNAGLVPLTVQPDGYPSAYLKPDDAVWLPDDPCHAHIKPCDAPVEAAADETGTE